MKYLTIAVIAAAISMASAACPNLCNGNGNCGASDRCTCYANWQGADCSERVCPYGLAWVDAPTGASSAHQYAECSNKGICDRSTGICNCYDGYEGKGCRRATCPNQCSGHGTCYFIEQISSSNGKYVVDYSNSNYNAYSLWDKSKIQACVCDPYYEGTDCSLRSCPKGDNVLTLTASSSSVQQVCLTDTTATLSPAGTFLLTYTDLFGGVWTTRPIYTPGVAVDNSADNVGAANIQAALEALPNQVIPTVVVKPVTTAGVTGVCYAVTFTDEANSGLQNLLTVSYTGCTRAGCAPYYGGLISAQGAGTHKGVAAAVTHSNGANSLKESAICSEHGLCDTSTGLCNCFSGFYDLDCNEQTVLV